MKGYVYILTNPSFEGCWIKIGQAENMQNRLNILNSGVPYKYNIYATLQTEKFKIVEKFLHKLLQNFCNVPTADSKEFFLLDPEKALDMFCLIANIVDDCKIENYDPNERKKRNHNFKFFMVGLKEGDKITIKPANIEVEISGDNKILYKGKEYTLSGFAKEFMPGDRKQKEFQGTQYFTYEGETLADMRKRIESENQVSETEKEN